ncbi:MAG: hypothetical protein AAF404_01650, partial [Pseudomonadota bacterium]
TRTDDAMTTLSIDEIYVTPDNHTSGSITSKLSQWFDRLNSRGQEKQRTRKPHGKLPRLSGHYLRDIGVTSNDVQHVSNLCVFDAQFSQSNICR